MPFYLATMRLTCTPASARNTQEFRDRFTTDMAMKWALMYFPGNEDPLDKFVQLLEADCLARVRQDLGNVLIGNLQVPTAWHDIGGYHSSGSQDDPGAVPVFGRDNGNTDHPWTFHAGSQGMATMKLEAGFWELEMVR